MCFRTTGATLQRKLKLASSLLHQNVCPMYFRTAKQTKAAQVPIVAMFDLFWSWHENTQIMPITFTVYY